MKRKRKAEGKPERKAERKTKGKTSKKPKGKKTWMCDACNFVHPAWHINCSHCNCTKAGILQKQGKQQQDKAKPDTGTDNTAAPVATSPKALLCALVQHELDEQEELEESMFTLVKALRMQSGAPISSSSDKAWHLFLTGTYMGARTLET